MIPSPSASWFARFGIDPATCRRVLAAATAHGADDADLYFEHTVSTSIGLSDRTVNRAHTSVDLGVGVRVVVGDQVGYAYTEDLELDSMLRAARVAAQIARGGRLTAPVDATAIAVPSYYPLRRHWADVDVAERVPLVRQWEEAAFGLDSRVVNVQTSIGDADKHVLVVRADGRWAEDYRPMTHGMVSVTVVEGNKRESAG